ncbi:hypothetical protein CLV43_1149 [Umezawaea tangerina]|uniref:Uncharacterized protein n=1 Tax=Umezawaea tangerina TaxID=84725 RepID=A0A2T0SNV7_9PSEU|nr:hypothetical protein CLV43_1149 [Umezawaea tangerina]
MQLDHVVEVLEHIRTKGVPHLGDDDARIAPLLLLADTANLVVGARPRASKVVSALLQGAIDFEPVTERYTDAERKALIIALGASGTPTDKANLTARETAAAGVLGISHSKYRKSQDRRQRFIDVAEAVLALVEKRRRMLVAVPAEAEPFVSRPRLEGRFRELVNARKPVIAFAGLPSVGKRTLARRLTEKYRAAGSSVVRLIGSSQEALQQSIITELLRLSIQDINYHVPTHSLRELMLSPNNPRFVVIEDAVDTELARFLTQTKTDTTVVLTTTRRLRDVDHVEVGELEPAESAALLSLVLPDITPADAASLAHDLGHHPLALLVAAALIAEDQADVSEFRRDLGRTIAGLLDTADGFPSLTGLYRTAIDRLSSDAREVLELLVYLDPSPIPTAFVVQAIANHRGLQDANVAHVRILARSALRTLMDHYLVRIENDQLTVPAVLTRTLVVDSTHDRGAHTAERSRASVLALVRLLREDRPDIPLLDFVQMCGPLVTHIRATLLDPWKSSGSFAEHLYYVGQALHFFLIAAGEKPWRLGVAALQTSESAFSIIFFPIPAEGDDVQNLRLRVQYCDPDLMEFERTVQNWRDHKRMQILMISKTLDISEILGDPVS